MIDKPENWETLTKVEKQRFYNSRRTKEQIKIYNQNSHMKNPERRKLNHKKYHSENKEHCNTKSKQWREENPDYKEKQNEKMRKWRAANPHKVKEFYRKNNLAKFGLTIEQYQEMYDKQEGRCYICGIHESILLPKSKLGIDHCHKTGKVRSLLCTNCNTGLGQFKDDVNLLQLAINYLNKNNE